VTAPGLVDLDGLPFLDDSFAARRLLAMTAAARHGTACERQIATGIGAADAAEWLAPARAVLLVASSAAMPALPLATSRVAQVRTVLGELAVLMPAWADLLALPVRYAHLHPARGAISASSRDWPQHVLLADEAFTSPRELREQLVHELAHQWLYLIEDLWPLELPRAPVLTLPSGTAGRRPAEVVGAAHVAAALVRLYTIDSNPQRAAGLTAYGTGCVELAGTSPGLTEAGITITQRLKEAL